MASTIWFVCFNSDCDHWKNNADGDQTQCSTKKFYTWWRYESATCAAVSDENSSELTAPNISGPVLYLVDIKRIAKSLGASAGPNEKVRVQNRLKRLQTELGSLHTGFESAALRSFVHFGKEDPRSLNPERWVQRLGYWELSSLAPPKVETCFYSLQDRENYWNHIEPIAKSLKDKSVPTSEEWAVTQAMLENAWASPNSRNTEIAELKARSFELKYRIALAGLAECWMQHKDERRLADYRKAIRAAGTWDPEEINDLATRMPGIMAVAKWLVDDDLPNPFDSPLPPDRLPAESGPQ